MLRPTLIVLLILSLAFAGWQWIGPGGKSGAAAFELPAPTMNAPEFPPGLEWLNTDRPLKLADLHGKVVMLDFWTYCCINCMHIIPDLKRLEREYPDELVVIGVHSAKFTQEGETANIRQAILRYQIEHPVVNDRRFAVWQSYGARAWPTVVLIDPEGRVVMTHSGEGIYGQFAGPLKRLVEIYDQAGKLDRKPLNLKREASVAEESFLAFPGKVTVSGERLFISDQNHNRVVVTSLDGSRMLDLVGSGSLGFEDGTFESATFNHPQGMVLVENMLYIADTENHAVRAADFSTRMVTTLAGNGSQSLGWGVTGGFGRDIALSSPWDLAFQDSLVYVAMAGTHQIWTIRTTDGYAEPFAGSAREGLLDGPRRRASLAQPSGLAILGNRLYFADSEVSAIRYVEIGVPEGRVGTVVGLDLFEFGDKDGVGDAVRLQHPLGVASDGKLLYVADTYNSKIKTIDPATRESKTLFGDGKPGCKDGRGIETRLYEPGGLCYINGKLYIADTNNGKIRIADLTTLDLKTLSFGEGMVDRNRVVEGDAKVVGVGKGRITVEIVPPEGFKINQEAQVVLTLADGGGIARASGDPSRSYMPENKTKFAMPVEWLNGTGVITVEVDYVYCGEHNADICIPGSAKLSIPIVVVPESSTELVIREVTHR